MQAYPELDKVMFARGVGVSEHEHSFPEPQDDLFRPLSSWSVCACTKGVLAPHFSASLSRFSDLPDDHDAAQLGVSDNNDFNLEEHKDFEIDC